MIFVTDDLQLDEREIRARFIRASGPGGQNVNKVATAVQLRFDVARSASLPDPVRERLIRLAGKRINNDGILVIDARRFRTQERNRRDAVERLVSWIRRAAERPTPRIATRQSLGSKRRQLDEKRRRGVAKRLRAGVPRDE
ncbi:MAG: aminoacyl-tRNA hydrolase [Chromatiales bacterium 21-64-14]|nr:MAG: aminoacyl-tRNA hydrolase [Chromatiales bacterium 21-64-14]